MARWQVQLSEYDIVYVSQKAIKGGAIADYLADHAILDNEPANEEFPDESIMRVVHDKEEEQAKDEWIVMFDGASNALGNGIGAVVISPNGKHFPIAARLNFECTNNVAEYEACAMGLQTAIELKARKVQVYGDSLLVISQMKNDWKTIDQKLIPYQQYVAELIEQFEDVQFDHIPRDQNQIADALATLASMMKLGVKAEVRTVQIEARDAPVHCMSIGIEPDGNPWFFDIKNYIKNQEYPLGASDNDKRTLKRLAMGFFLSGEVLYKRGRDMTMMRCVDSREAESIMEEIHEGVCGAHMSGKVMAQQIMRTGFYWLTMESDCINYARKCHKCQVYADKIHIPPTALQVLTSPWPFSMWGMDVIGPIEPKASNGHRFILVAIDYFTKWIEAETYAHVTQNAVIKFMKRNILCRFGIPHALITDNAKNLNNKMMKELCERFKIKHHNSSPYRPKMNGAVEAANKNIKKILSKMVVNYRDWHDKLPYALHAYRTNVRTSTGNTPYALVYGMDAVIPVEVEVPTLRILMESELDEAEWIKARYEQLNLIDEHRMTAMYHGQLYQQRMMRAFNKKVHPRQFKEGDLVLKRILPGQSDPRGKWSPNYEGPYIVKQAFSGGALKLMAMDEEELPNPINSDVVKKYYT